MEVNDVKTAKVEPRKSTQPNPDTVRQRSVSALSANTVHSGRADGISLTVSQQPSRVKESSTREKANELINSINLVSDATNDIDKLVNSLAGIADQASSEDTTPARIQVLEGEAREIIEAIKSRASTTTSDGLRPLAGDTLKLEAEAVLGKTLEVILPNDSKNAFGLEGFPLSPAENIIKTRKSVEDARGRLEALKSAVSNTKNEVEQLVTNLDVAIQNAEATTSSVRDLDQALKLTSQITGEIKGDPEAALSASSLDARSTERLQ